MPDSGRPPQPRLSPAIVAEVHALRERALADDTACALIGSLTTEVGPRLAGTPGDARAVRWAVEQLREFDVHHTANDTIDAVDPHPVCLDVAAYATLA